MKIRKSENFDENPKIWKILKTVVNDDGQPQFQHSWGYLLYEFPRGNQVDGLPRGVSDITFRRSLSVTLVSEKLKFRI